MLNETFHIIVPFLGAKGKTKAPASIRGMIHVVHEILSDAYVKQCSRSFTLYLVTDISFI